MKKKTKIILIVSIIAVLILAAFTVILLVNRNRITPYVLMKKLVSAEGISADVHVESEYDDASISADILASSLIKDGTITTQLVLYNVPMYYENNRIALEDGTVYRLSDGSGTLSDSSLRDLLLNAMKDASFSSVRGEENTVYTVKVREEDAARIFEFLFSDRMSQGAAADSFSLTVTDTDGNATGLSLTVTGTLEDSSAFSCSITAENIVCSADFVLPDAAAYSLREKEDSAVPVIDYDYFHLLLATCRIIGQDTFSTDVTMDAQCGWIDLSQQFELDFQREDEVNVCTVSYQNKTYYFNANGIVDANGQKISFSEDSTGLENYESVLDKIIDICRNGTFTCTSSGNTYVYRLNLQGDDLKEIFNLLLPQASALNVSLSGGTLTAEVTSNRFVSFVIHCEGSVPVLFANVPVSVNAEIAFAQRTPALLPEAVKEALK